MMGQSQSLAPKLFYHNLSLEQKVPPDHALRRIKRLVDFTFTRSQVADLYGERGNVSVDPAVILKLMFLLFFENVKSERKLMAQLPLRLDWLWFCDYDLDEQTPHHSVISKARGRWGPEVFDAFFVNILQQCVAAGLVDGETIHIDSSMIEADASKDRLQPQLRVLTTELCQRLEAQPDAAVSPPPAAGGEPLAQRVSPADPEARLGKKYSHTTLGYKNHRVIDDKTGIITATLVTPADTHDAKVLTQAIETHQAHTDIQVTTAVADKAYGNNENYQFLRENAIKACIPHQKHHSKADPEFSQDRFSYDGQNDCYICPAGKQLARYDHARPQQGQSYRYRAPREVCQPCRFFSRCVASQRYGRQITRNLDSAYTEWAANCLSPGARRRLLRRRRFRAEGSFADAANNHGFKRARWRGLIKVRIQNLLIATIQNLRKLLRHWGRSAGPAAAAEVKSLVLARYLVLAALFCRTESTFNRLRCESFLFPEPDGCFWLV